MTTLPIAILAALAALGAGLVPGSAPPLAAGLLLAACLRPLPAHRLFRAGLWSLVAVAVWTLATTLPVGPVAGPWRGAQWSSVQAFVALHGDCLSAPVDRVPMARLSLHSGGTWRWLLLVLGAGGMFCLVASLRSRQRLLLAKLLAVLGALVAATGLAGRFLFPREGYLMGWYPVADIGGGNPFGPFVNRNHFAAFCALLTPLALTLTLAPARRPYGADPDDDELHGDRGMGLSLAQRLLFGACLLTLLAGVLASLSRGGTAAVLVGLATVALFWLRRGPATAAWACLAGLGGVILVALWPDAAFQGRLHDLRDTASALGARWPVWIDSFRLWSQVPLLGCGANAFGMLFPQVTHWATVQQATHAESDILQLLAEGGVVGVLLVGATLGFWCLPLLQAFGGRHRASSRALPYPLLAGVAGALAAVGFQSCVDIPLRIPLCAWMAAAVAGLAAPRASRRRHPRPQRGRRTPCGESLAGPVRPAQCGRRTPCGESLAGPVRPAQCGRRTPCGDSEPSGDTASPSRHDVSLPPFPAAEVLTPASEPASDFRPLTPDHRASTSDLRAPRAALLSSSPPAALRAPRSALLDRLALAALLALTLVACWHSPGWQALYRDRDAWLSEAETPDIVALLAETPAYWQAWYELGERLCHDAGQATGTRREALSAAGLDALRAALRCSPRDPRLHGLLATSLWTAGQWDEARQHRAAQLALTPDDRALRLHWLQAEWQAGHTEECSRLAYRFVDEAGAADPGALAGLLWLAERELAEGSVTRARDALLTVQAQRPTDPALLRSLARCEARLGDSDREAEWLRRLTGTGAADAAAWWRLAELARAHRDRTALLEALGRAVQLDPARRRRADEIWKDFVQSRAPTPGVTPAPR